VSSKRRFACWKCGKAMRKKGLYCKRCKRTRPQSVKAQTVALTKSLGAKPRPVPVPVAKPPRPRCPNPACGAKGGRKANACTRCGTPFGRMSAMRAEKAAQRLQLSIAGSPAYWEARARAQWNPVEREACLAEAAKARRAYGTEDSTLAALMVKASGAGSVREAWLKEADPQAREVLLRALNQEGGRSA
jgi:predicted amidophosphoribosyltransferase